MKNIWFFIILLFTSFNFLTAGEKNNLHPNHVSVNLLAIPGNTGVVTYERYFNKQSLWLGFEHRFNDLDEDRDRNTNSIALEYRRYFGGKPQKADGFFAGVYAKTRWGIETHLEKSEEFHRYTALFPGINGGYQYQLRRLVLSFFAGYGFPVAISEESNPKGNPGNLNDGFKKDLRLGLTIGFAF
ncbi:MAG: hypothetical protein K0B37_13415 [Bacteroidales bacterium]|nr:hypothetical protein [Bacteroidales bacterium]